MTSPIHCLSRAVIIEKDQLLVSYNPQAAMPYVYLPGGHIEEGESAHQALAREMMEETGLSFEIGKFLGVLEYTFVPNNRLKICHTHEYNFCFLAHCLQLKNNQNPPEPEQETVRFKWVPLAHLSGANLLPSPLVHLLPLWLETLNPPHVFSSQMA